LPAEVLEELHTGSPHVRELFHHAAERPSIEIRIGHVIVLLKTGQRRLVIATDTECTVSKDTFGVGHVAYEFFDAPFAGRIRTAGLLFRYRAQQRQSIFEL